MQTSIASARPVARLVRGQPTSDGAGVRLTRVIGGAALPQADPFLLLDEFGADDPDAYIAGFPDHPHRGFETVTYMLEGRMRHRDNKGHEGVLESGGVQWMTAGRGIVHSEMPEQRSGRMRGFQLWVNLPASDKMREPRYQELAAERIPSAAPAPGVKATVIAGCFGGIAGAVSEIAVDPLYVDLRLDAGSSYAADLPTGHTAFVYVFEGEAAFGGKTVPRGTLALLGDGDRVGIEAGSQGAALLLIAGRPIGEPVARYGPFVMNTRAELEQAFADFQAGRL
ncbi:MAG TPA: pirin family protein [Methylomirabilota bacterium]|nr:pirin family protein [Methylomirabilota bacterium]